MGLPPENKGPQGELDRPSVDPIVEKNANLLENASEQSAEIVDPEGVCTNDSISVADIIADISIDLPWNVRETIEEAGSAEATPRKPKSATHISDILQKNKDFPDSKIEKIIKEEVDEIIKSHQALDNYEVIFLYDFNQIRRTHASSIYQHLASMPKKRNILLILKSPGGEVEPAYLISKMCNRLKLSQFIIGIPAEAKSAATLLSLGADELHMGAMSELGPIDPQINDFPALAFSSALEKIAQLSEKFPGASEMLAKYLIGSELDVRALGHYDRITESSTHYALRLLQAKTTTIEDEGKAAIHTLASHFTNHYKDHNFVIDIDEAQELLTEEVVKSETPIYAACHEIHKFLETFETTMLIKGMKKRIVAMGRSFYITTPTE
ncbi:SDH family Clp fold serine proteinase [Pseudomonas atacamensis]|uniref:SDH family Clp fold serine proteinase n=1 Tax=Pseudomonas atacamensis TaxID=2565368 RepID=UPI003CAB28F9